jgi:hypothetical protein
MAGGSNSRQRNQQILVRFSDAEFAQLIEKADQAGLARAAFMRAVALGQSGPRAQRRPPADHVALRRLLGELGRVGNNLNQIARALNATARVDSDLLTEALGAYIQLRDAIFVALNMDVTRDQ